MSKAVLVIDMPSGCIKCPMYDYVPSLCFLTDKFQNNIGDDFKPDWCPLKPMPEKANHPDWCDGGRYDKGYNACIDELLADKE